MQTDRAHIKTRGSGAKWNSDEFIHLCRHHHIEQGHLNWKRFSLKYPKIIEILNKKGWEIVDEFGVSKIRRIIKE